VELPKKCRYFQLICRVTRRHCIRMGFLWKIKNPVRLNWKIYMRFFTVDLNWRVHKMMVLQSRIWLIFITSRSLKLQHQCSWFTINSAILNGSETAFTYSLYLIFNKSLSSGIFPDILKLLMSLQFTKAGAFFNITNYRPILLLCTISFRVAVIPEQHGIFRTKSTMTNLLNYTEFL
jgi:hypothetical protein